MVVIVFFAIFFGYQLGLPEKTSHQLVGVQLPDGRTPPPRLLTPQRESSTEPPPPASLLINVYLVMFGILHCHYYCCLQFLDALSLPKKQFAHVPGVANRQTLVTRQPKCQLKKNTQNQSL